MRRRRFSAHATHSQFGRLRGQEESFPRVRLGESEINSFSFCCHFILHNHGEPNSPTGLASRSSPSNRITIQSDPPSSRQLRDYSATVFTSPLAASEDWSL